MIIDDVHRGIIKHKARKRVGRGMGSGTGKTAGKGDKGASSRSGHSYRLAFEGGQKMAFRRIAKRGFNNAFFATKYSIINLRDLEKGFNAGDVVDPEALLAKGLLSKLEDGVKVLANGELTKKLTVKAHQFSQAALDKIQKAGGSAEKL